MKQIRTRDIRQSRVRVPGSKSLSHRFVIMASLAGGRSEIKNVLKSEDIDLTSRGLKQMGADIRETDSGVLEVEGVGGRPAGTRKPVYLGNSGTSMRLLAGVAALGGEAATLTGDDRMCRRPMGDLLDALRMAGARARSETGDGTPPVVIDGRNTRGGKVDIDCSMSSQYLSSLLIAGAVMEKGLDISVKGIGVSTPYIELTVETMKRFGVTAEKTGDRSYRVPGSQTYTPGVFTVEPDMSNAGYFWAAGALTGRTVRVCDVSDTSLQGDIRLVDILREMGCRVEANPAGIGVCGEYLRGVTVNMADTPDAVPALAVVAAYARGRTVITHIGHLREKECDRIDAVSSQLSKMGVQVETGEDWLAVRGGAPHGARIETFNDHRIAMAFAVAGLVTDGVIIENPGCVAKSFPGFWEIFDAL